MTQPNDTEGGNSLQRLIDGFGGRLLRLEQANASSQTEVNELKLKVHELETSKANLHTSILGLEEANKGLHSTIIELKETCSSGQVTIAENQASHATLREDIDGLRESQQRLANRLDAVLAWRDTINSKIARAETQVTGAATASNTAQNSQAQVVAQLQRLQDTVTKQQDALVKRLQNCEGSLESHTHVMTSTATADGMVIGLQRGGSSQRSDSSGSRSPDLGPSSQADHAASDVALATAAYHSIIDHEQSNTLPTGSQSAVGPEYSGLAPYIDGAFVHPGILAMRNRMTRQSSVASSVTFCGDNNNQRKKVSWEETTKPPVPPFSPARKESETKDNLIEGGVQQSIENAEGALTMPAPSKPTDDSTRATKRQRLGGQSSSQSARKAKAPAVASRRVDDDDDDDGDEIVVARRKSLARDLPNITDFAAGVEVINAQRLDASDQSEVNRHTINQSAEEESTPVATTVAKVKPSPVVFVQKKVGQRVEVAKRKKNLNVPDSDRETLSDVQKAWGIGNHGKENDAPEEEDEEMPDAIAYKGVRRSGRGPKPKPQNKDEIGVGDDEFMRAAEIVTEPKKRSGRPARAQKSTRRRTTFDDMEYKETKDDLSRVSPELGMDL